MPCTQTTKLRVHPEHALFAIGLTLAGSALAQPDRQGWQYQIETGAIAGQSASMDAGGDVSVNVWSSRLAARYSWANGLSAGLSLGYGEQRYDFDTDPVGPNGTVTGFSGNAPWSRIRNVRVSAPVFWQPNERWNLFAIPTMRWNAERNAALDDGRIGGLLTAASYRVNDRLSIGPGFGVFSELEDDTSWFPILAIDWRITDSLTLSTGRGFAATRGPGLSLGWEANEHWSVSLGGRYEKERFRLDKRGVAPGGIGESQATSVYLVVTRRLGYVGSISAIAGVDLNGSLRLEDADGDLLERTDYGSASYFGATAQLRF
jgi:hypothetical protein